MSEIGKGELLMRLRKVEGQIRGIHKMITDDRNCSDIVIQLSAARKALDKVSFMIASRSLKDCVVSSIASQENPDEAIDQALKMLMNVSKHGA